MAEGNQATTAGNTAGAQRNRLWMIAGTAAALLGAGVLVQVLRPTSAYPDAAAAPANPAAEQSGKANVADRPATHRPLARVNRQMIGWDEVADECMARYAQEVLDNLINRKIIQQACEAQGIEITDAEVNGEIVKIAKRFNLTVENWLQMLESERHLTPAQYKRDVIWPMLALRKLAGDQVTISKQELERGFIRNYGQRVKARVIVLDNPRRAAEVWEKARAKPDEFERLARQHSIDPSSRSLGGSIPPIPRYASGPEEEALEKAAFKLKENEISSVVQIGESRFVILYCEGRTEQIVEKMDQEIEKILRQELQEEKVQKTIAKVFQKIKDDARIDNFLTGVTTGNDKKSNPASAGKIKQTSATMPGAEGLAPKARPAAPRTAK